MPLPMKTLREAAAELGIPEAELRVMVESKKVRASMRKGSLCIAPDELAKVRKLRKTTYDTAYSQRTPKPVAPPPKPAATPPGKTAPPPRASTATPGTAKTPAPRPGLKLPEPPPK